MNLDVKNWKEYKISDLFIVKYGVNLELNACEEVDKTVPDSVNFVARTASNNGVTSRVRVIDGVEPQEEGLISVAGGGSVLSTFVQNEPFYSGRDLYTLKAKENISLEAKLFVATVIEQNKYKYSYGRQANKTLPDILLKLPSKVDGSPDWQFMENYIKSLHHKPLTTKNTSLSNVSVTQWQEFRFGDLISYIGKAKAINKEDLTEISTSGKYIRYITRTASNNGCELLADIASVDTNSVEKENAITIGDTTATCFYQAEQFICGDHMVVVRADWMNPFSGLFIATLLSYEHYKYSYGRAYLMEHIKNTVLKLPVAKDGTPDWKYMENYIKSLPYGDRLEG